MWYSTVTIMLLVMMADAARATDPFPECDAETHDGCRGSATKRAAAARNAVKQIDLSGEWSTVRRQIVSACGLRVKASTSHCFEDFNHVDCCTMVDKHTHRTNRVRTQTEK